MVRIASSVEHFTLPYEEPLKFTGGTIYKIFALYLSDVGCDTLNFDSHYVRYYDTKTMRTFNQEMRAQVTDGRGSRAHTLKFWLCDQDDKPLLEWPLEIIIVVRDTTMQKYSTKNPFFAFRLNKAPLIVGARYYKLHVIIGSEDHMVEIHFKTSKRRRLSDASGTSSTNTTYSPQGGYSPWDSLTPNLYFPQPEDQDLRKMEETLLYLEDIHISDAKGPKEPFDFIDAAVAEKSLLHNKYHESEDKMKDRWIEDIVGNNLGLGFQGLISRLENEAILENWQQSIQKLPYVVQAAFYDTILTWNSKYNGSDVLKSWRAALNNSLLQWNQQPQTPINIPQLPDVKKRLFNLRLSTKKSRDIILTYQKNGEWVCHLCFLDPQTEAWKLEEDGERKTLTRFLHDKGLNIPVPTPNILEIFSFFKINVHTYLT